MSGPLSLVKKFYSFLAGGEAREALRLLSPSIEWTQAERTPYYIGTMRGVDAIVAGLFEPLNRDFSEFKTAAHSFVSEGDLVVAFGNYSGLAKVSGRTMSVPFVHVWTVSEQGLQRFVQYTDSAVWNEALAHP